MPLSADDIVAIQQLLAKYNHTVDANDPDGFVSCFVPEGSMDSGAGPIVGHEKLKKLPPYVARMNGARHFATNVLVEGDGDEATVKAYLAMILPDGDGKKIASCGVYNDTVTRTASGWKFVTRVFTPDR
ncbi:MAG: nuclear transport factor 2 family protein [Acidimicrobiia bacterium]